MTGAVAALLPDGRLHLQHGPIDCLCRAWGAAGEVGLAYGQAAAFFRTVLQQLCNELPLLRTPLPTQRACLPAERPWGDVARAMHAACVPFADRSITPMAAVAGAVADAVLAAMVRGRSLSRAFVNNGGDIAFHLARGSALRCGLLADLTSVREHPELDHPELGHPELGHPELGHPELGHPELGHPELDGTFLLTADRSARGIATSGRACKGRGGRSFSFGIANSVSILARTAAAADAAATIVGNAVDLPSHPAIDRRPASDIDPASDLGDRLVTFDVGPLSPTAIRGALDAGAAMAENLRRSGLIDGAVLALRGQIRVCHSELELA